MKSFLNYLGQVRIYSLIDLVLLLLAAHANNREIAGVVFLHLGFLAYLEYCHAHTYRKKVPILVPLALGLIGICLFGHPFAAVGFIVFSILYSFKNKKYLGLTSPLARGLQNLAIIAGITGGFTGIAWLAFVLIFSRNFLGDMRDIEKDRKEGIITLPVSWGLKKDVSNVHLFFLLITTFVWWYIATLSLVVLILVCAVEVITYNMTSR